MQRCVTREGENITVTIEFPENAAAVYDYPSDDAVEEDTSTELVSSVTTSDDDSSLDIIYSDEDAESQMSSDTMTRGELKVLILQQMLGNVACTADAYLLLCYVYNDLEVEKIYNCLASHAKDIGDAIAAKNEASYEAVAKMPAYSTVIKARRAEVEAMLDAGNQKEYLAQQRI